MTDGAVPASAGPADVTPDGAVSDAPDDDTPVLSEPSRRRGHRRASTPPPPGSDPHPAPEPPRIAPRDNDERMRLDKPPHY